jgi:hypothetical protein
VSFQDRIAKLEALLHRVRGRAGEPRPPSIVHHEPPSAPATDRDRDTAPEATPTAIPAPMSARAAKVGTGDLGNVPTVQPGAPSEPQLEAAREEFLSGDDVEMEEEEAAPSSSRRRVEPPVESKEKPLEELAFGTESVPPRHTPPPESGRLPAAPEFDQDVTGVRETSSLASPQVVVAEAVPVSEPEVLRPVIAGDGPVATFVGSPPVATPLTFGDLLDATLGL